MKTMILVKDNLDGFVGRAALYKCSPAVDWYDYHIDKTMKAEYIIISAVHSFGVTETFGFPSDSSGKVISWSELDGSLRGVYDHLAVIEAMGYKLIEK